MPIYDLQCQACSHAFEALVRGSTLPACPACASANVAKLLSLTAPRGKSAGLIARGRAQAAREGHFSNYAPAERPRRK